MHNEGWTVPIRMTGAQAAITQLVAEGVEVILGIPGEHNIRLCDAVLDHTSLKFVSGRHEQGITFMANGYARASKRIAVPITISGPGVTNSLTSLADAYLDSVPMVLIAAQAPLHTLGKGAFHELKDQTALLTSVTKWNTLVRRVEDIPGAIRNAFVQAYHGRPGPTAVEIPLDVQEQCGQVEIYPSTRPEPPKPDPEAIHAAALLLAKSRSPLIYAGRGAALSGCSAELVALIERFNYPCFTTPLAKGVVPDDHPLNLSWGGAHHGLVRKYLQQSDAILVVGSSLDEADTDRLKLSFPKELIQIDIYPENIGRKHPVSVALVGDAREILSQLLVHMEQIEPTKHSSPVAQIAEHKQKTLARLHTKLAWQYMDAIQRALPQDAIVTNDASWANDWAISFLQRFQPNTFNITRMAAALGYAFPAALGAKLAYPKRQAVALVGDGGFLFTVFSLATAVQNSINAVVVVFNDASYSTIGRMQAQRFGRTIGVDLVNPNFCQLAEAFGAAACRVDKPDQLYDALLAAWDRKQPTLIEVPLEKGMDYLI